MHWSTNELESAGSTNGPPAADPTAANAAVEAQPLALVERVAELLEQLYAQAPELVVELLRELGRCSTADLVRLFGVPASVPAGMAPEACPGDLESVSAAPVEAETETPLPAAPAPAETAALSPYQRTVAEMRERLESARYDANGSRTNHKVQSAFPRQLRYVPGRPPGATHMSD